MSKYSMEEVRARLGFTISDHNPRILTWASGECQPASMAECALWDAYANLLAEIEQAQAGVTDEVVVTKNETGQIVAVTRQDDEGHILEVINESAQVTQVDAEKVREVIEEMRKQEVRVAGHETWADKLTAALQESKP